MIAIVLKLCAITAGLKKYESIIKKMKKTHGKIILLEKSKLNCMEVLIFKGLTDLVIRHCEYILINNVLKEYSKMREEIKHLKISSSLAYL